ncbi:Peptidase_C39 like family protein [Nonomuraea pusilla]|uniref:Peptidase_C39 like family protein n=1 Tax=Nonomuraea pusilla TaxID=46177 RepID=A0A1H7XK55_9ACTN|nr:C39 family peptidase [Nonomuraea pusilla]SEM34033.1 Peptidase_C39 like family protein [Nonomuraea pusilla]
MGPVLTVDLAPVAFTRFAVPGEALRGGEAWTGEERAVGFAATQLVPSWTARTPAGCWIEVELRVRTAERPSWSKWYVMGRWSEHGDPRTSVPGQGDGDGDVAVDTFVARRPVVAYQVRVTAHGEGALLTGLGVLASAVPPRPVTTGRPSGGGAVELDVPRHAVELDVPRHSQHAHAGHHPHLDGGGANWCSPASVAMVLGFWGRGPGPDELALMGDDDPAPAVDHAAAGVYDHSYQGTGNWPFNVAYAGRYGLSGFVTRLRSAAELELFARAGIPLVASLSFKAAELPGSCYSTNGHLLVVTGVTAGGDVVVNDPAAPDDAGVRRVYPRAAFENVWLRSPGSGGSGGSGGIVYVLHPPDVSLPDSPDGNW